MCSTPQATAWASTLADVLAKVEEMVKLIPVAQRGAIGGKDGGFNGNSLETLAKCPTQDTGKITYLPSRNKNDDGHLIRLRKNKPDVFRKVTSGEISMVEGRRAAGMKVVRKFDQIVKWLPSLTAAERRKLREMLG
jgi:hypothetical protein